LNGNRTEFSQNPLIINTTKRVLAGETAIGGEEGLRGVYLLKKMLAHDFFIFR
jgi:hypothetical protein